LLSEAPRAGVPAHGPVADKKEFGNVTTGAGNDTNTPSPEGENAALGNKLLTLVDRLSVSPSGWLDRSRRFRLPSSSARYLLLVATMASLCGTGILLILNSEAKLTESNKYSVLLAVAFVAVLILYRHTQRVFLNKACAAIERALDESRCRIVDKVMKLTLRDVETMTRGKLTDGLARHYEVLSQTIMPLAWGFESLVLTIFMLGYTFYLSLAAGILTIIITVTLVVGYTSAAARLGKVMEDTKLSDANLSRLSEDVVSGFKELRLNKAKTDAVVKDFAVQSGKTADFRVEAGSIFSELYVTGGSASFLLVAGVVFLLPILSSQDDTDVSRIVTAALFLLGPIGGLVSAAQQFATARFVVGGIRAFERDIDAIARDVVEDTTPPTLDSIEIRDLHYTHGGADREPGFVLTGVSLDIRPGRITFISGGNGSGKTTAMRLVSGLYPPDGGEIRLNGERLPAKVPQSYRELFSTVFADFHIFHKPYALDDDAMARLEAMLERLRIRDKLPADLRQDLNPDQLSTGQRKRLALALALAEDRPILLLDEWAADQDPATREDFYRHILGAIKAEGKAIIAVSHDERFFDCADVRYHMEDGKMTKVQDS
jgi:putative ATP-binding cassette transporter